MISDLFIHLFNDARAALRPPAPPDPATLPFGPLTEKVSAMKIRPGFTPPKSANVATRELTYTINGTPHTVPITLANDPPFSFLVADGDVVTAVLVDVSKNGVRSDPSGTTTVTAQDLTKPGTPDAPTLEVLPE